MPFGLDLKRFVADLVREGLSEEDAYRQVYAQSGLEVVETYRPLGKDDEPYEWVNETTVAPWVIYVLGKAG